MMDNKNAATAYVNEKIASAHLGIATVTLTCDRSTKRLGIPYYKLGKSVRYRLDELDAWMETHKVVLGEAA